MFVLTQISLRSPLRFISSLALLAGLSMVAATPAFAQDTAPFELDRAASGNAAERNDATTPASGKVNRPLMLVGAALFVGSYGPSLAFATLGDWQSDDSLAVPVAGPWMSLANPENEPLSKALLINSGVMQGLGVLSMTASLLIPNFGASTTLRFGKSKLQLTPAQVARDAYGLGAVGSF